MEIKTIPDEVREELRKPFPAEAISQHPTKTFLSTIKAIYVVERLNDVFGIGGWIMEHEVFSDEQDYVSVKGHIYLREPYKFSTPTQYGGHKKTGTNTEPADGYKSAVTDCQSKCASYLEIGIDIFKGLVSPPKDKGKAPTSPKKESELSQKQWDYMLKIGNGFELGEDEVIKLVKWVAGRENLSPRHWKIAKLLLPEENFNTELALYNNHIAESI